MHFSFRNRQIKIRFGFLNIGEYVMKRKRAGLGGPVMALRDASPQAMHHFTRFDQVRAERPRASVRCPVSRPCPAGAVGSIRSFASFARCPIARARERASRKPAKTKYRGSPSQALIRRPAAGTENLTKPNIAAGYHLVYAFPRDAPPSRYKPSSECDPRRTPRRGDAGCVRTATRPSRAARML